MRLPVFVDPRFYDAVIFDLDGVVTDTAAIHAAAWKAVFDDFLSRRAPSVGEDHTPLTDDDYHGFIDGMSRLDGVANLLKSRGISVPWGSADDEGDQTVCGIANRKQQLFMELTADGVPVFESTVDFVRQLQKADIVTAVFSSSRNCAQILYGAGLSDLFPVRVDGVAAEELGLPGKPHPAMLHETAKRLGVRPQRCVVVEDAQAGVAAGHDGGFGLVIGVDRIGRADDLRRWGADVVVHDLVAVSVRGSYQRISAMPDALRSYSEIAPLAETRQPVVLLDFDGTLSEIVGDPDAARLTPDAEKMLVSLAARCPVAVISGRSLADIRGRIGVPGVWYAGSHGFELVAPDGTHHQNEAGVQAIHVIGEAVSELRDRLAGVEGILIEDKRFTVAVHYRNVAPARIDEVIAAVRIIGQRDMLRVTSGRKVIELRPDVDWGKGKAVEWIVDRIDGPDLLLPIYIGDDLTDEDAFDATRRRGIGVAVRNPESGDRRSAARFVLDDPDAVSRFLTRLADQLAAEQDTENDPWKLTFGGYDAADEKLREALCTMGNGYLAVRGAAPECDAGEFHYPGTYVAGIYNRLSDEVSGTVIDNESLVNLPNWLPLTFRINDGPWFAIDDVDISSYLVTLDIRRATLSRDFVFSDQAGRITRVRQSRFVAMHLPHAAAMETTVQPENWSGRIEFRSVIDGGVQNKGVDRYRDLSSQHLAVDGLRELSSDSVLLEAETVESKIRVAVAMRTTVRDGDAKGRLVNDGGRVGHRIAVDVGVGGSVTLEKIVTVFTSRDRGISGPVAAADRELSRVGGYADLERGHRRAWAQLWERFYIEMGRDADLRRVIRLQQLHLVQTLSPHTAESDVGVPARGLHGEAYRGHVFWDELFVFPVTNMRLPEVTRSLLMYRYRRLPEARRAAREAGYAGAMFPWQSGSDGREESQRMHLNPRSGRWNPDASARAHHVGLAIAYNVWQYFQVTGDVGFLIDHGAEMLAEIARFWVSLATFDPVRDRYVIRGVIGPDEFHSGYPGREYDGIDNNAYTNVIAVWVIIRALEALEHIPLYYRLALLETLGIDDEDLAKWEDVSRRMFVPFHDGVLSQFEGYEKLRELDWESYRTRYDSLQRLDRILEAENDSANNYKASKQADVLMLFYLLSADELYELFDRLGYRFTPEQIPKTIDYYKSRTSHGSTLSAVVHAWVLARGNRHQAMEYFAQALASDVVDIQGGTTAEGIHLAAMAGTIDLLQRCFTGLEVRRDRIVLGPLWPKSLGKLAFTFRYRGHRLRLGVSGRDATLSAEPGDAPPVLVECRGAEQTLVAGGTVEFTA
ncbi:trehalose-phosphatase [Mycolicibacterium stellerae]|uniref:trehalose-phosphatase n=1 Tax=Mycolicibacterium stellerae TaxID=2358193 RepID=UPI001F36969E|nr:trehalose-phosphatase [Mycolicibacterium stellerae]